MLLSDRQIQNLSECVDRPLISPYSPELIRENEGWEEIPKYLFNALNRFEDERQAAEAEAEA
jgi:hypothetical protein